MNRFPLNRFPLLLLDFTHHYNGVLRDKKLVGGAGEEPSDERSGPVDPMVRPCAGCSG